jgi:hypothetical protein
MARGYADRIAAGKRVATPAQVAAKGATPE